MTTFLETPREVAIGFSIPDLASPRAVTFSLGTLESPRAVVMTLEALLESPRGVTVSFLPPPYFTIFMPGGVP